MSNILEGAEAMEAMYYLMLPKPEYYYIAIMHQGNRYGGFRSDDHARWFIDKQLKNEGGAVIYHIPKVQE